MKLVRRTTPALHKIQSSLAASRPARTVVTWAEQDNWEDPRGPLGIDRPSPKLAPLTPESPSWLNDLHKNGVRLSVNICEFRRADIKLVGSSETGSPQRESPQLR